MPVTIVHFLMVVMIIKKSQMILHSVYHKREKKLIKINPLLYQSQN